MVHRALALVLAFSLLSTPAQAASSRQSDDEATRTAKHHFKAAETNFTLGRFEEALEGYSKAYEARPLPALLFNIGQCHFELGNHERAIFFYEQYLRGEVDTKKRALVNRRLEEARAAKAAAELKQELDDADDRERQALVMRVQEQSRLAAARQAELEAERLRMSREAASSSAPIYKTWWFWTAAGGVAVIVATSIILATRDSNTQLPSGDLQTIDARSPP